MRPTTPKRALESKSAKLAVYAGAIGAEALVHAAHFITAPVLAEFVDAHVHGAHRHTLWYHAAIDWLPGSLALASVFLLYRHLSAHTHFFYIRTSH